MINIKDFDSNLLKIDERSYKSIDICCIGYIKIKKKIDDCENIHSVNPSYLVVSQLIGHIQEKNGNKYLVFDSINTLNFGMGLKMNDK